MSKYTDTDKLRAWIENNDRSWNDYDYKFDKDAFNAHLSANEQEVEVIKKNAGGVVESDYQCPFFLEDCWCCCAVTKRGCNPIKCNIQEIHIVKKKEG